MWVSLYQFAVMARPLTVQYPAPVFWSAWCSPDDRLPAIPWFSAVWVAAITPAVELRAISQMPGSQLKPLLFASWLGMPVLRAP